ELGEAGPFALSYVGEAELRGAVADALPLVKGEIAGAPMLVVDARSAGRRIEVGLRSEKGEARASRPRIDFRSMLPPLMVIFMVLCTRRVLVSLAIGVLVGAVIYSGPHPVALVPRALEAYVWDIVSDKFRLWIFVFTFGL